MTLDIAYSPLLDSVLDAAIDSLIALPILFVVYLSLELLEQRFEKSLKRSLKNAGRAGPFIGALFGCVPQCGFSVLAAALYAHRSITLGTLLAVYLSTSDEAIPVILAQPDKAGLVAPLILLKLVVAIVGGYLMDALLPPSFAALPAQAHEDQCHCDEKLHCCGIAHQREQSAWTHYFWAPLQHALRVFFFILVVSVGINLLLVYIGEDKLHLVFLQDSLLQPFLAVLVGLIPNCAASVAIAQVFLKGGISFGSAIAGLSASAGIGLLVLFKEENSLREIIKVVLPLAAISLFAGIIVDILLAVK